MTTPPGTTIHPIAPEGEVSTCPVCGYTDGFHVSFLLPAGKTEGDIRLICPNCHERFDIGWKVSRPSRSEFRSDSLS